VQQHQHYDQAHHLHHQQQQHHHHQYAHTFGTDRTGADADAAQSRSWGGS
jgi:hypothetical protein